ncbi:MAG: adhesin [Acidobacteria bacterium]|nr:adhesin [Acidobacteriota bacterium]
MLLPNAQDAIIDEAKLRDDLLSEVHPVGRFKARVFAALGFTAGNWREFDEALRTQHLTEPAVRGTAEAFGQSYTIRAILKGPAGAALVTSVWFLRTGDAAPRFVTAYPGGKA